MENKILWVDDIRIPPSDLKCDIARDYDTAISLLTQNNYEIIYLDHDLADFKDGKERTGYTIVLWLAERKQSGMVIPTEYRFLTANPVGRKNMLSIIERYLI